MPAESWPFGGLELLHAAGISIASSKRRRMVRSLRKRWTIATFKDFS
jgi:hypothetical protein